MGRPLWSVPVAAGSMPKTSRYKVASTFCGMYDPPTGRSARSLVAEAIQRHAVRQAEVGQAARFGPTGPGVRRFNILPRARLHRLFLSG